MRAAAANTKKQETKPLIEMAMSDDVLGIVGWILENRPEFDTIIKGKKLSIDK